MGERHRVLATLEMHQGVRGGPTQLDRDCRNLSG
jgi:hypothetical protein